MNLLRPNDSTTIDGSDRSDFAASFRIGTYAVASLAAVAAVVLHRHAPKQLEWLCREDGVIETLTALLYAFAGVICLRIAATSRSARPWMFGYAALFLFVAGEEISWGQRLFGLDTPPVFAAINVQEETTLHNITGIHGMVRMMGLVIVAAICFGLPMLHRLVPRCRALMDRMRMPVFPLWSSGIVLLAVAFMAVPRLLMRQVLFELDEVGEVLLAVPFVIFAFESYFRHDSAEECLEPADATTPCRS